MTAEDEETQQQVEWRVRLDKVRRENQDLYVFVQDGEDNGTISKEASRACFRASVDTMRRAGIITPQLNGEGVDDATLCTVVAQANHEARQALLRFHPEIANLLETQVPRPNVGRSR